MQGRNGPDDLCRALLYVALGCCVVAIITGSMIIYLLFIVLIAYGYFRMFSKNVAKRYEENMAYRNWRYRMSSKWAGLKRQWTDRDTYRYFKCPHCGQKVRVPKGKGKISITCPKCRQEFIKKT